MQLGFVKASDKMKALGSNLELKLISLVDKKIQKKLSTQVWWKCMCFIPGPPSPLIVSTALENYMLVDWAED